MIEDIGEITEEAGATATRVLFRANVGMRSDYTSNARLSGDHGSGDVLWMPTLDFGMYAPLGRGFSVDLGVRAESVLYSRFDERSFIGYSATATLDWRLRPNLPRIYVGAEPYRFDSLDTGDLLTQAIGLSTGTDWGYSFNGGSSLAFVGYSFTEYLADPSIDRRMAHRAVAGLAHQFSPRWTGQLFYAYQFSDYENVSREDSRHVLALSVIWQLRRNLFATMSGTFVDNDATQRAASYQTVIGSLGLSWQF